MTQQVDGLDAAVHYRWDPCGARVAVLPATCRHGHDMASRGYRARESGGVLRLLCSTCAAEGVPNPSWRLASTEPVANVAELDDGPYVDLVRRGLP